MATPERFSQKSYVGYEKKCGSITTSPVVVPPQYLNQKDIAEGIILSYMDEDYGQPKEFTLIESRKYKGEVLYIYKCLMDFGDEENNYFIAICSQPSDKTKYTLEPTVQLMSKALKDVENYKKVLEDLLKNYEKNKNGN